MNECVRSSQNTPRLSLQRRAYETTYHRAFPVKRSLSIGEGSPFGQRFLLGAPYNLQDDIGASIYMMDYSRYTDNRERSFFRPNTSRANRPHPHRDFPFWPRKAESLQDLSTDETEQALRNQLNSTYQVDFNGASQGFPMFLAYQRPHSHWREKAKHTLDSEYRYCFQDSSKLVQSPAGRYGCSPRKPADAIVPQTLPVWKKQSLQSIYGHEISDKAPTDVYMREFVDSLGGPMN